MKIAVALACLVAVAILDSVFGRPDLQLSSENRVGSFGENILNSLTEDAPRERRRGKSLCKRMLGGRCTKFKKPCRSHFPYRTSPGKPFCGKFHRCCHDDACVGHGEGNKFVFDGISHCSNRIRRNWTDTRAWCEDIGMTMAQPADPIGLGTKLSFFKQNKEEWFWLGGQGNGTDQVYLDGTVIANDSSLWREYPNVTVNDCILLWANIHEPEPLLAYESYGRDFAVCQQATRRRSIETTREELYSDHWNIDLDENLENENIQEDQLGENKKDYESDEVEAVEVE